MLESHDGAQLNPSPQHTPQTSLSLTSQDAALGLTEGDVLGELLGLELGLALGDRDGMVDGNSVG